MKKNISMSDFCKLVGKTENEIKNGYLDLWGTGITSLPEGLTVGGYLDLRGTGITSLPEGLTVGGSLDLRGTGITSLPEGLTVGGSLDLWGTGITSLPEGLTVGGYLDLRGTGITSLPEGLTVGGSLYLRGTGITSLPEGLTVGGSLDLEGTGITSLPEGLTVGGSLDLEGTGIKDTRNVTRTLSASSKRKISVKRNAAIVWEWSNRTYIKVDGIFSAVDSHHGNVWRVHQLGSRQQMYVVTDGENHYAHGKTLEEARKDLIYKICDRDKSDYDHLTPESSLSYAEAVECYRVITGACAAGTRQFCESVLKVKKDSYTIREVMELTQGQYGSERFREFFSRVMK